MCEYLCHIPEFPTHRLYFFFINLREQHHLQYIIISICYWTSLHSCLENPVIISQLAPALPLLCFPISLMAR